MGNDKRPLTETEEREITDVLAYLSKIVANKGYDHCYTERKPDPSSPAWKGLIASKETVCVYVWEGQPDCIIGHLMLDLGMSTSELSAQEGTCAASLAMGWGMTGAAAEVMQEAQAAQDGGAPWGEALNKATILAEQYRMEGYRR